MEPYQPTNRLKKYFEQLEQFNQWSISDDDTPASEHVNDFSEFAELLGNAHEIPAKPKTAVEERQELLKHFIKMMISDESTDGLFCWGAGGTGKSKTIMDVLHRHGIEPTLINSHITPMALYQTLYQHREDTILWLDDADSIYGNMAILGLLRSALWGHPQRIVTYTSSQLEIPQGFVFKSKIIMTANEFPVRNEAFKAVLSRCDVFELSATNAEIIEQMRAWADMGNILYPPSLCHEVVDFIEKHAGERQLSLRLYEPSLSKYDYAKNNNIDWEPLVLAQLQAIGKRKDTPKPIIDSATRDRFVMIDAVNIHPNSVRDQEKFWCERTGKSRASFYRLKKKLDGESA